MRTKALFVAAFLAAGLASSMAQNVYSLNVVGYYNVTIPANTVGNGFAIVANQLQTTDNDIAKIIPAASVPNGTTVYSWDSAASTFITRIRTTDDDDNPLWNGTLALDPGTGFWVKNPTASPVTITFVGEVLQGALAGTVPAGFSMKASQVPQSGDLASVLGYPATPSSTVVYFWRSGAYDVKIRTTDDDDNAVWNGVTEPAVGEGFWVKENVATTWTRNFTVQ